MQPIDPEKESNPAACLQCVAVWLVMAAIVAGAIVHAILKAKGII